jgi:hypothetical protein
MWRNPIGGLASSRFHRPGPEDRPFGIGANELARAHMRNARAVMEEAGWPNLEPGLGFLRHQSDVAASVQLEKTHLVYTRNAKGAARLYLNGAEAATGQMGGQVSTWDVNMRLALANEFTGDRSWRGTYHGVAIYDRAMTAAEIADHYAAGAVQHRAGLQVLYRFDEGEGIRVSDVSGITPALDLRVQAPSATAWMEDGLEVRAPVVIATAMPAERLTAAIRNSNAFTLEAWITPDAVDQVGPARIVTLSTDHGDRNFTLGQENHRYEMRFRTTTTSGNGLPSLATPADVESSVAATRSPDGHSAVVFITHGGLVQLDMDSFQGSRKAEWFHPLTAERRAAAPRPDGYFQPPSRDDWVLVLR